MPKITLTSIRLDGGTQPRAVIDKDLIGQYVEAMMAGAAFPAPVVFFDGENYWLADGFHRYYAHSGCQHKLVECDVRQGTQRDAILYSVGANAEHGWRRTNEDKRRAVTRLLEDAEWASWSDREIARQCRVNHEMVGRMRPAKSYLAETPDTARTVSRGGKTYEMKTSRIGKEPKNKAPAAVEMPPESIKVSDGVPDVSAAPKRWQDEIERFKRHLQKSFDGAVKNGVRAGVTAFVDEHVLPQYNAKLARYNAVISAHKGVMPRATYRKIKSCLHTDRSASDERLREALEIWQKLESVLVAPEEAPAEPSTLPKTRAEFEQRKQAATAERKAKAAKRKQPPAGSAPRRALA